MHYATYFKTGQKILLRTVSQGLEPKLFEEITVHMERCGVDYFDLSLPYEPDDDAPLFGSETEFHLVSDAYGLGVQLTGHFLTQLSQTMIRIRPHDDLQVFSRRQYPRIDMSAKIYCVRGKGSLRTWQARWRAALKGVAEGNVPPLLVTLRPNLSASGLRIPLREPVTPAELCLVYLDPGDAKPPVCALCETVWTGKSSSDEELPTGLRFVSILAADQERLAAIVLAELKRQGGTAAAG